MSTSRIHRAGAVGVAALVTAALLAGCSSSKSKTAADSGATNTTAAAVAGSGAPADEISPTQVKATGGGKFCQEVAQSLNSDVLSSATGDTVADLKSQVQQEQALEAVVKKSAPDEIKPDLAVLFGAVDKLYDALAKANYDFTKLDPTLLTSFDSADVSAAEQHLDAYVKNTCGIDTGDDDSSDAPSLPAAS